MKNKKISTGGLGAEGNCVCSKCDYSMPHKKGVPCMEEKCPKCGAVMLREGSTHHLNSVSKK